MVDGGESSLVGGSGEGEVSAPKRKWWQCCKACRREKKDKKPPKLGWIQGVLVRHTHKKWHILATYTTL